MAIFSEDDLHHGLCWHHALWIGTVCLCGDCAAQARIPLPPFWHVMVWPFFAVLEGVNCIQKTYFFFFCEGIYRYSPDVESISWRHLFLELEQKTFLLELRTDGQSYRDGFCFFSALFRVDVDTGLLVMFAQCGTQSLCYKV